MSQKAPMPPWWVEVVEIDGGAPVYLIVGATQKDPVTICRIWGDVFENAKELADFIVQRTKQ